MQWRSCSLEDILLFTLLVRRVAIRAFHVVHRNVLPVAAFLATSHRHISSFTTSFKSKKKFLHVTKSRLHDRANITQDDQNNGHVKIGMY